ncbi:hypothetical protein CsatB_014831 [Cannabis sativa]
MDRNWMSANRLSAEYSEGVDHFLDFCQKNAKNTKLVLCPCLKCGNMERVDIASIKEHLFRNGIDKSYKVWVYHGEKNRVPGEGTSKSNKVKGVNLEYEDDHIPEMIGDAQYELNVDPLKFQSFVEDAEKPIYPNCNRFTKLSTLIRLYKQCGYYVMKFIESFMVVEDPIQLLTRQDRFSTPYTNDEINIMRDRWIHYVKAEAERQQLPC